MLPTPRSAPGRISEPGGSDAERACQLALAVIKKDFNALHLMGLIHFQRHDFDRAQDLIRQAVKVNPRSADALTNLSFVLQAQGQYEDALRYLDKSLRLQPTNLTALNNRGNLLWLLKRPEEALDSLNNALAIRPNSVDALCNRGNVLIALERFDEALKDIDAALSFNPRDPILLNNRANVLWALERHDDALQTFERAFAIDPLDISILKDRGSALLFAERPEDALDCFDRALAIKPNDIYFLYKRGTVLAKLDRFEEALACFDKSLDFDESNVEALNGRGNALASLTRAAEAIAAYNKAIELDPETPEAHWNRSLTLLQTGNFKEGWKEYEWRWKTANFTTKPRNFDVPLWLGNAPLEGKTILLHAEQGFGDSIQFGRYITMVAALGAHVIVEVQAPLKTIFSSIDGASKVIAVGEELPAFDFHCPMLSLPLAFRTELDSVPHDVPYLAANADLCSKFSYLVPHKPIKLVGLAWAGRSTFGGDRSRSIGLRHLAPVLQAKGCHFVGIQKDLREGDMEHMSTLTNLTWVGDQLSDFSDTAALMSMCDMVISSDTAVVHLAGALARPIWILLEQKPDWRWLVEGQGTPWYPTARLFRQPRQGDWDSVVASVIQALNSPAI